ncbi:MAG: hypothetical protein JWN67_400 [Actinomycetia bacterium]|nr:hypothetical protein [Actinomycetes bacterium]
MIAFVEDRLPADATAVPLARHQLALALLTDVSEATLDTVLLLANEAVSSALRSSTEPWRLRVDIEDVVARVSVRYRSTGPATSELDELRDTLFQELSDSWGTEVDAELGTTTIWFEVGLVESPAA